MANKVTFRDNGNYHVVTTFAGDVTKTDIYHKPTGLHARGNAKRYHSDAYDFEIGGNISYYRALERLSTKILNRTIKDLPKEMA